MRHIVGGRVCADRPPSSDIVLFAQYIYIYVRVYIYLCLYCIPGAPTYCAGNTCIFRSVPSGLRNLRTVLYGVDPVPLVGFRDVHENSGSSETNHGLEQSLLGEGINEVTVEFVREADMHRCKILPLNCLLLPSPLFCVTNTGYWL